MSKKILAVVLSLILALSVIAVPVGAANLEFTTAAIDGGNIFNLILDKLISVILKYLNMFWPGYEDSWSTTEEYVPENFYEGDTDFNEAVDPAAKWSMGYASASLLEGIAPMNGDFYLAGSLEPIAGRVPSKVEDDQRVRVYALSDGVGGTLVHAVVDGFGLARRDVQTIRERFSDFAEANNVTGVNVSVLHQHSCIDTLGMNVPLAQALIFNSSNAASGGMLEGSKVKLNQVFMENLFEKTVFCMKKAVATMKEGTLSYGTTDISDYIRDKRDPQAFDGNIHRLRFQPDDNTAEIWVVEAGIHLMSYGAGGDILSGDFPIYLERELKEADGINLVYVQGAELAIGMRTVDICADCGEVPVITKPADENGTYKIACPNGCIATAADDAEGSTYTTEDAKDYIKTVDNWNSLSETGTDNETALSYGKTLAKELMNIKNDKELAPVLNIAMKEVKLNVTNQILTLAAREDVLNSVIVKNGDGYQLVTEIGYAEIGNEVAVFLCPGEFDPALIYGGPESGDASWMGGKWELPPLCEVTDCENVMVFGLCNDQSGYVLRDNEYHSLLSENEEVNVISTTAGSTFVNAFLTLLEECA
ncbi:MAG: hypothetical protein IIX14_00280 [Clostridia bacterium]|nr:hypothetical protein [Clostridia bacterium]